MNMVWIAFALLAQARPHTYTPGTVLNPGGVPPPARASAPIRPMGGYGQSRPRTHPRTGVVVPVFAGYVEPEAQQPPQQPPSVIVNPDYQPQVQNPSLRDYSNVPLLESPPLEQRLSEPPPAIIQQADQSATIFLIALKDGTIVAAIGYWVEGETLSYVTRDGTINRVSIDRVDGDFSVKLNAERKLDFKLP